MDKSKVALFLAHPVENSQQKFSPRVDCLSCRMFCCYSAELFMFV